MLTYEVFNERYPEIEVSEGIFKSLVRKIRRRIDFLTFERIKDADERLQKRIDDVSTDIICELYFSDIGFLNDKASNGTKDIKSESVGEYKVEYNGSNRITSDKKDNMMANLIDYRIREAFIHTGLMFRGFYDNERQSNNY